jgi:hypothetical protein
VRHNTTKPHNVCPASEEFTRKSPQRPEKPEGITTPRTFLHLHVHASRAPIVNTFSIRRSQYQERKKKSLNVYECMHS